MTDEDPPLIKLLAVLAFLAFLLIPAKAIQSPVPYSEPSTLYLKADTPVSFISEQMERIITCESEWDSTAQNSESTAYGFCQFTDGTWEHVQKKWGIELDRHNYQDQIYACRRLLKEEGTEHWKASEYCWSN